MKNNALKFKGVNVIHCSQLIQAISCGGEMEDAMDILDWMSDHGIKPDGPIYLCLLKPCRNISNGKKTHRHIVSSQTQWNLKLQNSLLNMYSKCGSMDHARFIFNNMKVRDVISWNAMIGGYSQNGNIKKALELFKCM